MDKNVGESEFEFEIRTAAEWIDRAKRRPLPAPLLGDLWQTGETAVLFGDTGTGKSVFAMQVADALSRGTGVAPLSTSCRARRVLYIDTATTEKQFETRYSEDHQGGRARFLHRHYKFGGDLKRVEYDSDLLFRSKDVSVADLFCLHVRKMVADTCAEVVIVDDLTSLFASFYGQRRTVEAIAALRRLGRNLGVSILAVVTAPRPDRLTPLRLTPALLRGFVSRADCVFGLAEDRRTRAGRYLKQVRAGGRPIVCDEAHVPVFHLRKRDGNFLELDLTEYAPEAELLDDVRTSVEWETIERIKALSDDGLSLRKIAAELGLGKSTAHKLLKMWRPPAEKPAAPDEVEADDELYALKNDPYDFPGIEAYHKARNDERFRDMFSRDDEEAMALRREHWRLDEARRQAREVYKRTGVAPPPDEMLAIMATEEAEKESLQRSSDGLGGELQKPPREQGRDTEHGGELTSDDDLHAGLTPSFNDYDEPILVEKFSERGERLIWYKRLGPDNYRRYQRRPFYTNIDTVIRPGPDEPSTESHESQL